MWKGWNISESQQSYSNITQQVNEVQKDHF
jgi:hypothetical protein